MDSFYLDTHKLTFNAIKSKRILRDPQINSIVNLFSRYNLGDIDENTFKLLLIEILEEIEIDGAKTAFEVIRQHNDPDYLS